MVIVGADGPPPVRVRWLGETMILRVSGAVTTDRAGKLRAAIDDLLRDRPLLLVIDLTGVDAFEPAGMRSLFAAIEDADRATTVRLVADERGTRALEGARPGHGIPVLPDVTRALAKYVRR